ncbi:hypothetical protein BVRB_024450, partial [Beta vulgaris subsp. vulgaris]
RAQQIYNGSAVCTMTISSFKDEGETVSTLSRRSSLSKTFTRSAPVICESSSSKAEHLGKRLGLHLIQFKKLLVLVQRMSSHAQRQEGYNKLLQALDRCEQSAVKIMEFDDEVALDNGRRRIAELRSAINASIAGYS